MAQSKREVKQEKELEALAPKLNKKAPMTKHKWNDDIFTKEKHYKDEKGVVQVAKANWRKFNMSGVDIVAKKGEFVSEIDYAAFKRACLDEGAIETFIVIAK